MPELDQLSTAERQVPYNLDAEIAVLGALLMDPQAVNLVQGLLREEHFYKRSHGLVYGAVLRIGDRNEQLTPVTLSEELNRTGHFDEIGGTQALMDLMDAVSTSGTIESSARIVRDKAILRDLADVATGILEEVYRPTQRKRRILQLAEQQIFAVTQDRVGQDFVRIREAMNETWEHLEATHEEGHVAGVTSEYHQLDQLTTGFQPGQLIIVAGRPSMGKSSFQLNLLENIAVKQALPCVLFTLEMSRQQICTNMLCGPVRIPVQRLRQGMLRDEEWQTLGMGTDALSKAPIVLDDTPAIELGALRGKCRRLKSAGQNDPSLDIQAVFVDYIQLMTAPATGRDNREREVAMLSAGLKALAGELRVPVIAAAQLRRAAEGREGHRPLMSDLRESGALEQDADLILLLHREEYYDRDNPEVQGKAELIVAKNRQGPTGVVELSFIRDLMRFENMAREGERYEGAEGE